MISRIGWRTVTWYYHQMADRTPAGTARKRSFVSTTEDHAAPIEVRKYVVYSEEVHSEGGRSADDPLLKVAVGAVISNPSAGIFQDDVSANIAASVALGASLTSRLISEMSDRGIASYGKGAIVGENGDQEQGVSFLTTDFASPLRSAVRGKEWISSVTKRGGLGTEIDIPLASKDFLKARSHYDAVTFRIPDAPRANEIVIVIAAASHGRIHERSGGLTLDDAERGA